MLALAYSGASSDLFHGLGFSESHASTKGLGGCAPLDLAYADVSPLAWFAVYGRIRAAMKGPFRTSFMLQCCLEFRARNQDFAPLSRQSTRCRQGRPPAHRKGALTSERVASSSVGARCCRSAATMLLCRQSRARGRAPLSCTCEWLGFGAEGTEFTRRGWSVVVLQVKGPDLGEI